MYNISGCAKTIYQRLDMSRTTRFSRTRLNFMKHSAGTAAAAVALGIKPVVSSAAESEKRVGEWYENIYRQFHID